MATVPIALYVPNILGYVRILLAFIGLHYATSYPVHSFMIWLVSAFLDLFDGALARKLNQTSSFGVLLDITADIILRSCVWFAAAISDPFYLVPACFVVCLEWFTMVATQLHAAAHGEHWKSARQEDPWLIQVFFANNFRNPLGTLGIYGLFSANFCAYSSAHTVLYERIPMFVLLKSLAFLGRAISMVIELWMCAGFISVMLNKDSAAKNPKNA